MERQYKNSGIEWIGRVPSDWNMQPLSIYFTENRKPNSDLGTVNALQFKYGEIIQKPSNGKELTDKDRELLEKYTVVIPDDIVVNGLNLNYDLKSLRIAKVRENGIITSAYIVLRPRNGANASYYNYYLKALDFQKIFHGMGMGIRLTLSYNELRSMLLPVPSADEQLLIAEYLDGKCGEIDGLISLQEKMIAQLTDYKQSVITEAVTKGLNSDVQFVPSGIDWIGDVPKGWNRCAPLKWFTEIILGKMLQSNANSPTDTLEKYICAKDVHFNGIDYSDLKSMYYSPSEKGTYQVQKGDMLVVEGGAGAAGAAIVDKDIECTYIQNSIMIVRPKSNFDIRYARYVLFSIVSRGYVDYICNKATIPHFTKDKLSGTLIPMPSFDNQRTIADYLDTKCGEIDKLIETKRQKIETLKEYKKSVIYETVTGKTDLRDS